MEILLKGPKQTIKIPIGERTGVQQPERVCSTLLSLIVEWSWAPRSWQLLKARKRWLESTDSLSLETVERNASMLVS